MQITCKKSHLSFQFHRVFLGEDNLTCSYHKTFLYIKILFSEKIYSKNTSFGVFFWNPYHQSLPVSTLHVFIIVNMSSKHINHIWENKNWKINKPENKNHKLPFRNLAIWQFDCKINNLLNLNDWFIIICNLQVNCHF